MNLELLVECWPLTLHSTSLHTTSYTTIVVAGRLPTSVPVLPYAFVYLALVQSSLSLSRIKLDSTSTTLYRTSEPNTPTKYVKVQFPLHKPQISCVESYPLNVGIFSDGAEDTIAKLHSNGKWVSCYISVGTTESWRGDVGAFPEESVGKSLKDWKGEKWLDVRYQVRFASLLYIRGRERDKLSLLDNVGSPPPCWWFKPKRQSPHARH